MTKEQALNHILELIKKENDGIVVDIVVPGFLAKPFMSYHSMREDLKLCLDATNKLIEGDYDNTIKACLWHTIIILYGKCFTDAASAGSSKLEANQCFNSGQVDLSETHTRLMELRNKFVAHRGSTDNEFSFVYLVLNPDSLERQARIKSVKRLMPNHEELINYRNLILHLMKFVESKIERAGGKIWRIMLAAFSPEELAMMKIAGPVRPAT